MWSPFVLELTALVVLLFVESHEAMGRGLGRPGGDDDSWRGGPPGGGRGVGQGHGHGHGYGHGQGHGHGQGRGKHAGGPPITHSTLITGGKTEEVAPHDDSFYEAFGGRYKRAMKTSEEIESNEVVEDDRPCVLHSIRYGCLCRYGDTRCSYEPAKQRFFGDDLNFFV